MAPPETLTAHTGDSFVTTTHHDTYPAIDPTKADLSGKVVLITGASKGIGRAISIAYAKAGVSGLALLARSKSGLEDTRKSVLAANSSNKAIDVLIVPVDITDSDSVDAAMKEAEVKFKRLDIVVNNAALMYNFKLLTDLDPSEWWAIWTVNIKGLFNVTRSVLPLLINSFDGLKTIVNITSIAAHLLAPGCSAYQTSKLAVLRLSELIVAEYGDKGILSYAVHPGGVPTEMAAQLPSELWSHVIVDTAELAADSIVFCSKERRDWLAGRYFSVNWDVDEFLAKKEEVINGDKLKVRMMV